ncbi:AAA family ATPase [Streptomyces albus]|uniref:AAA domain-containing protein n=1 Tax=Streptomyces albus TaxID=1888 RepID=UPI0013B49187|nr:AAA domain-containing protein [Streptomyces albus]QID40090.1 AAA family ATPase [Streptomyces albus]
MTATTAAPVRPLAGGVSPAAAAAAATEAILADALEGTHRGVVVDSPPGAGKSTLVVRAARELAAAGHPLMVIAQTNAQVDDLVDRLARADPELPVGRLHSNEPKPYDPVLDGHPSVRTSAKPADLAGLDIVVSTAAKWAWVTPEEPWRHAIVDEAYQMRSDALLAVAGLFERALFVGDPGQLDPFSQVGVDQWAGQAFDPSASAVSTLLAHNPGLPQHRLPVSWRLPHSAAELVSDAFYPYTPFRSGTGPGERLLSFTAAADGRHAHRMRTPARDARAAGAARTDCTVVLHPLSGRPDATAFHLETGRLCVLASRHRHACVVVCRAGAAELLDEHPATEPVRLGAASPGPDGWEAHQAVLSHLAGHRVPLV